MFLIRCAVSTALVCAVIMNSCAAIQGTGTVRNTIRWSSADPLSIPHSIRQAHYQKKNLAPNPSFEIGSVAAEGTWRSITLKGWEITGQHIEWIDKTPAPYASEGVGGDRHAIKMARYDAGELDGAEGIISNYIPVIPGNYSLAYDVKIQDLSTGRSRLGMRLSDSLAVKILFYDADKSPIPSAQFNPASGTSIDSSDKSYPFANFWSVERFPWGTVRGRTYNYPFSEGDLPDGARYVRLFFGLKGNGTLWLDHIDYRYSKWNFTTLERMTPYVDKKLAVEQRLIPSPKQITRLKDVTYWNPLRPQSPPPLIVLPNDPSPAERAAAKLLHSKISALLSTFPKKEHPPMPATRIAGIGFSVNSLTDTKLVFSIGDNGLYRARRNAGLEPLADPPGRSHQGYVIASELIGETTVVYLVGESPVGAYYAATTAVQLLHDKLPIYHNAAVVDFPDFLGRSYTFRNWRTDAELQQDLETIEHMSLLKLNKVYAGNNRKGNAWYQPDALFSRGIAAAGWACRMNGVMTLGLMVNPYSHFPFEPAVEELDPQLRHTWIHGSPQSLDMLKNALEVGLSAGAKTILLHADDHVPHKEKNRKIFALYTKEDEQRFINLQNAQAHVITQLKTWLDTQYPGTRFEFCPPWYANEFIDRSEGRAEVYFKELIRQIPTDIGIIWTGPTVRSLSIDMADLYRYASLIRRWPMLWDNTLYARNIETRRYGGYTTHYPGKVRMCNLFEPYDTYRPNGFHEYNDGGHLFTNADAFSEIYRIKYATVADYEWNTADYHPELSLWKSLVNAYGPVCAKELLYFNDAYYTLYGVCLQMEMRGVKPTDLEIGTVALKKLNGGMQRISTLLNESHPISKELAALRDKQEKRFYRLSRSEPLKN